MRATSLGAAAAMVMAGVVAASATGAGAGTGPTRPAAPAAASMLVRLAAEVQSRLATLAAAREPPLVPPTPTPVAWRAAKLGSLELGAPLLAMVGEDMNDDGTWELYAVTTAAVVVIALPRGKKPHEVGRVAFGGSVAVPQPRDPLGSAFIEHGIVVASASPWTTEVRVGAVDGRPAPIAPLVGAGLAVCPGERRALVPGRNYYGDDRGAALFAVQCRDDLVGRDGARLHVRAALAAGGKLGVMLQRCHGSACAASEAFEYPGVGMAFAIADIDTDGTPEVIVAGAGAPGDADAVRVIALGDSARRPLYQHAFNGGIAALAVVGGLGKGPTAIAAVRLAGATRVDLWRLD